MHARSRFRFLTIMMAIVFLVTGCWGRQEIEDSAFIMQFSIDLHPDDDLIVTAQVAVPKRLASPSDGSSDAPPFYVASTRVATIHQAFREQGAQHSRPGLRAHATSIIIGEELARQGVSDIADFLIRDRETRLTARVYVADGDARTILSVAPTQNANAWEFVQQLADNAAQRGTAPRMRLHEVELARTRPGEDLILPRLALVPTSTEPIQSLDGLIAEQASPTGFVQPGYTFEARGAAVFREDRMVGWLSDQEVRGVLWVRGLGLGNTIVELQMENENESYQVNAQPYERSAKVRPDFADGQLQKIDVQVTVEASVTEIMGAAPAMTWELLEEIGAKLSQTIQNEIEEAVQVAKVYEADIFSFGEVVRQNISHDDWQQLAPRWREVWIRLPVEVRVEATIRRTGALIKTLSRS